RSLAGYAFVTPATLLVVATYLAPLAALAVFSLTDYELGAATLRFTGLSNYLQAAADPVFWRSLRGTLIYVAIVLPGGVGLGLLVAVLVQQRKRLRHVYEVIYFLPVTSTLVAMATVWRFMLHPKLGPVTGLLALFGIPEQTFLTDPNLV